MIDRSVIGKKDPNAVPLSKDQITSLKLKAVSVEQTQKPIRHTLDSVVRSILHYCTFSPGSLRSNCKQYGHVLPRTQPEGVQLYCGDCGAKINSPSQLRGSTAVHTRESTADTGSWK